MMGDEVDVEIGFLFDKVATIRSVVRHDDKIIIGLEDESERDKVPVFLLHLPVEIKIVGKVEAL